LDKPYIVAVNAVSPFTDQDSVIDALFGTEQLIITDDPDQPVIPRRQPNGVWKGPSGPQYTRVSAILVATRLRSGNIADRDLTLYHNPWAALPYAGRLTQLSEVHVKDRKLHMKAGVHPRQIFALPEGWPEHDVAP
jgi:hypothetical protein